MLSNKKTGKVAQVVYNGIYGFQVYFGYSNGTNDAYGNETWVDRKTYKSEKTANKKAEEYVA